MDRGGGYLGESSVARTYILLIGFLKGLAEGEQRRGEERKG